MATKADLLKMMEGVSDEALVQIETIKTYNIRFIEPENVDSVPTQVIDVPEKAVADEAGD